MKKANYTSKKLTDPQKKVTAKVIEFDHLYFNGPSKALHTGTTHGDEGYLNAPAIRIPETYAWR